MLKIDEPVAATPPDLPAAAPRATPKSLGQILGGVRELLDRKTRRSFGRALVACVAVAMVEMLGLVLMIPLLSVLSTGDVPTSGVSGRVVDVLGLTNPDRAVEVLTACVFGSFVVRAALTLTVRWWLFGLIFRSEATTARTVLHRYLSAPFSFHLETNSAGLLRTLTISVEQTYGRVVVSLLTIATETIVALAILGVLVLAQPLAALGAIVYFAIVYAALSRFVAPRSRRIGMQLQRYNLEFIKGANQAFGAIKHIQLGSYQDVVVDQMHDIREDAATSKRKNQFLGEIPRQYLELAFIIGIGLLILAVSGLNGRSSIVTVIGIFAVAGFRLLPGLVRISNAAQVMQTGLSGMALVLDDLEIDAVPQDRLAMAADDLDDAALSLEHVSFCYPGKTSPALKDITLSIRSGESVALVGSSGAGKTTLVDLVMGLHRPTSGRVSVADVPLDAVLRAWQGCIGLVPQDIYLIDGTIRENIAFGSQPAEIDEAQVQSAVRQAQLQDLIAELPVGLDTVIGERGVRLSGGQRQRLGIARALYRRPRVLILDEATSALDSATEAKITETLRSLHGRLTMVTIAHRLSTIRDADRIILMTNGTIEAEGGFRDLQDRSPLFRELVSLS